MAHWMQNLRPEEPPQNHFQFFKHNFTISIKIVFNKDCTRNLRLKKCA